MSNDQPLKGQIIIFTGTPKSEDVFELVEQLGGTPISLPLIQVSEWIEPTDEQRLMTCPTYDWLIFTSQSAVESFGLKMKRFGVSPDAITSQIAAIGTRTAAALTKIGLTVQFIPTVFSADVFVQEFKPTENETRRLLFLRGSIAGVTIREELPFDVDEWTVYSTEKAVHNIESLKNLVQTEKSSTLLFASPSAVNVFSEEIAPFTGWDTYKIGAIGHVTEQALIEKGAHVDVIPSTYTLKDLVLELIK
ncbi:uroporphyrinogen-III synthase [Sporosarcina siberiensis]|uniref:Uroporphyrinogen-III synthase n=1 Tax=Sporosarcina siberiensis TaxID=1365606 RepID=A0ABW4SCS1_9BACL